MSQANKIRTGHDTQCAFDRNRALLMPCFYWRSWFLIDAISGLVPEIDILQWQAKINLPQQAYDFLQVVAFFAVDPDLVSLDAALYFYFRFLDLFDDHSG